MLFSVNLCTYPFPVGMKLLYKLKKKQVCYNFRSRRKGTFKETAGMVLVGKISARNERQ